MSACPQCGAPVVVDVTARQRVAYFADVRALRGDERIVYRLREVELTHCSACEWSCVLRQKGSL